VDFVVSTHAKDPLVFVEIKDNQWADNANRQLKVDIQMRNRFKDMANRCCAPHLWGLSILGTRLQVYVCNIAEGEVTPPCLARPNPYLCILDEFLAGAWGIDITSQEGFECLRGIVADVVTNLT